jgi:hypothetical protein
MTLAVKLMVGVIVGAAIGYALHRLVGCASGACPIWSSPGMAMLYGGGLGALLAAQNG